MNFRFRMNPTAYGDGDYCTDFFKVGVDSRLGTPWYGFPVSLWIWTGISAILLSPFSMMAVGQKEAAKQRRQRCLRWPIRWIHEFSSNEFGFNDPGSGNDDFGVTVFVEIIPDTGIPTRPSGIELSPQRYFKGSGRTDTTA
jgi:hypothetical protein